MDKALQLFSSFPEISLNIYRLTAKVAFLILVTGLITKIVQHHANPSQLLWPLVGAAVVSGFIAYWPTLTNFKEGLLWQAGQAMAEEAQQATGAGQAIEAYKAFHQKADDSFKSFRFTIEAIRLAIMYGAAGVWMDVGRSLFSILRGFQVLAIGFVLAFGPLNLAFLFLNPTKSIGTHFMLMTAGVFLWDFALALVDIGTINLCNAVANATNADDLLIYAFLIPGWVILGYLLAPFAILKALTSGTNLATAMALPVIGAAATVTAAGIQLGGAAAGRAGRGGSRGGGDNGNASSPSTPSPKPSGPNSGGDNSPPRPASPPSNPPGSQVSSVGSAPTGGQKSESGPKTAADLAASVEPTGSAAASQILHQVRSASVSGAPAPTAPGQQEADIKRSIDKL
jgi:hypothetical protein